ncbi:MAG: hypothetical protein KF900_13275, partial [Bacteroidetes bacterium]|nr:hypothetical protein [Bacteroidota bacterium]
MKNIYKRLLTVTTILSSFATAQINLIDPAQDGGFELGNTPVANGWNVTNSASSWIVGVNAPVGFSGNNSAYVSSSPPNFVYTNNSVTHLYKDVFVPPTSTLEVLSFSVICVAESGWDYMRVYLTPTSVNPVGNTQLAASGTAPNGIIKLGPDYAGYSSWTPQGFNLPSGYAGNWVRIIFEFRSDGSVINSPPAIDNVKLVAHSCTNGGLPVPSASISSPSVCAGTNVALTASGGGPNYFWIGPNSFTSSVQNPVIANPSIASIGTYSVFSVDNNGCVNLISSAVNLVSVTQVTAEIVSTKSIACLGTSDTLHINTNTGNDFQWNNSITTQSNIVTVVNTAMPTVFTATVTDLMVGCSVSVSYTMSAVDATISVLGAWDCNNGQGG